MNHVLVNVRWMGSFLNPPPHGGVGAMDPLPSTPNWCGSDAVPSSSSRSQARTNNDDDNAVSKQYQTNNPAPRPIAAGLPVCNWSWCEPLQLPQAIGHTAMQHARTMFSEAAGRAHALRTHPKEDFLLASAFRRSDSACARLSAAALALQVGGFWLRADRWEHNSI
jgi:hypothetical protein